MDNVDIRRFRATGRPGYWEVPAVPIPEHYRERKKFNRSCCCEDDSELNF